MIEVLRKILRIPASRPRFDAATCARIKAERLAVKAHEKYREDFIEATRHTFQSEELAARLFGDLSKTSPVGPFPVMLDDQFWELYGWDVEEIAETLIHELCQALPRADWTAKERPDKQADDLRVYHFVDLFHETIEVFKQTRRPSLMERLRCWLRGGENQSPESRECARDRSRC